MRALAFLGSPRRKGNSSLLAAELLRGFREGGGQTEEVIAEGIHIRHCRGCLRCNILKQCAIRDDDWPRLSQKIQEADVLVFASPVYFHHLTAPLKNILDRFRSFFHVRITETGLEHTPWHKWNKDFVLALSLGSPGEDDARPVVDLFTYMSSMLGAGNRLHTIIGTRLAVTNQVQMTEEELRILYGKLDLSSSLAEQDCETNRMLLKQCHDLGKRLAKGR